MKCDPINYQAEDFFQIKIESMYSSIDNKTKKLWKNHFSSLNKKMQFCLKNSNISMTSIPIPVPSTSVPPMHTAEVSPAKDKYTEFCNKSMKTLQESITDMLTHYEKKINSGSTSGFSLEIFKGLKKAQSMLDQINVNDGKKIAQCMYILADLEKKNNLQMIGNQYFLKGMKKINIRTMMENLQKLASPHLSQHAPTLFANHPVSDKTSSPKKEAVTHPEVHPPKT
jgi:hypothetical protein